MTLNKQLNLCLIIITLLLCSCSFHTRSSDELPTQLQSLYLNVENPYNPMVVELQRTLESGGVHFATTSTKTRITLKIDKNDFSTNIPAVLDGSGTPVYSYTLSTTYSLIDNKTHNVLYTQSFTLSDSLYQEATQLYTPQATELMKRELSHNMVVLIYNSLLTKNVKVATSHAN